MDSWAANPCSRKTSPPMSKQKVYCASTAQVWALHDAMPEHLRVADVDFLRGVVHPVQKWHNKPLKTDGSAAPIPIPIPSGPCSTAVGVGAAVAWRVSGNQRSRQRRGSG